MIELDEAVVVPTRSTVLGDVAIGVAATLAALGVWLAWTQLGGVDLTVRSADAVTEVGAGSVTVTALVVSGAGVLLVRLLESWLPRGLRWWTVVACAVWAVSMLGPLGATTADSRARADGAARRGRRDRGVRSTAGAPCAAELCHARACSDMSAYEAHKRRLIGGLRGRVSGDRRRDRGELRTPLRRRRLDRPRA